MPVPNRFQLQADVKDAMIFNTLPGTGGASRAAHNIVIQVGAGLTFEPKRPRW